MHVLAGRGKNISVIISLGNLSYCSITGSSGSHKWVMNRNDHELLGRAKWFPVTGKFDSSFIESVWIEIVVSHRVGPLTLALIHLFNRWTRLKALPAALLSVKTRLAHMHAQAAHMALTHSLHKGPFIAKKKQFAPCYLVHTHTRLLFLSTS